MAKLYVESLLGDTERILFSARQHWFILASSIFLEVTVILAVFAGTIFAVFTNPVLALIIGLVGFFLILIPLASMVHDILVWSHRQFIITNWRVMQVSGVINKNVTDSSLEKVNDVKLTQSALGRMFGYGDIEIMTASELGVNLFKRIDDPIHFKTTMINAKEYLERQGSGPRNSAVVRDIPAMIAQLDELRKQGTLSEEEFQEKKKELLGKL